MRFIIVLFIFTLISCSKTTNVSNSFHQKYNWISSSGGLSGTTQTPANSGKTSSVVFTSDSFFETINGVLDRKAAYDTVRQIAISGIVVPMIVYSDSGVSHIYSYFADTLQLQENAYDGQTHLYKKE